METKKTRDNNYIYRVAFVFSRIATIHASARKLTILCFRISVGLAPAVSQLVSYNERSALASSPLGLPRWKPRLVSYSADTRL